MDDGSKRQKRLAAWTLVFLAPFVAEVLSGATLLSTGFVFIPEMLVWGCGALLIREFAVRYGLSWGGLLLLGLALGIGEEALIQQTSLAPIPWPSPAAGYGRFAGVNWIYGIHMIGYEAVWVVVIPIVLTHLLFPQVRNASWLSKKSIFWRIVNFILGCLIAWSTWTQIARVRVFHAPPYVPSFWHIAASIALVVLLVGASRSFKAQSNSRSRKEAPHPMFVGVASLLLAVPWWILLALAFVKTDLPWQAALAIGAGWAILTVLCLRGWTRSIGWSDIHRFAVCVGGLLANMSCGFLAASSWSKLDLMGKIGFNLAAIALLWLLGAKIVVRRARSYLDWQGEV